MKLKFQRFPQIDGAAIRDNKLILLDNLALKLNAAQPIRLPAFQIRFDVEESDSTSNDKDIIELPLYSNSTREHLICTLKLSTTIDKEAIILSGAALVVPDIEIK